MTSAGHGGEYHAKIASRERDLSRKRQLAAAAAQLIAADSWLLITTSDGGPAVSSRIVGLEFGERVIGNLPTDHGTTPVELLARAWEAIRQQQGWSDSRTLSELKKARSELEEHGLWERSAHQAIETTSAAERDG